MWQISELHLHLHLYALALRSMMWQWPSRRELFLAFLCSHPLHTMEDMKQDRFTEIGRDLWEGLYFMCLDNCSVVLTWNLVFVESCGLDCSSGSFGRGGNFPGLPFGILGIGRGGGRGGRGTERCSRDLRTASSMAGARPSSSWLSNSVAERSW